MSEALENLLTSANETNNTARALATKRMCEEAEALGADAIVCVRYASAAVMQNAAEVMKHTQGNLEEAARLLGGNCDGAVVTVRLNAQWQVTTGDDGVYLLRIDPAASGESLLGRAQVVLLAGEKVIFSLNVSWQEVR